jgi:Flagellar basal body L-ring protein
MIDFRLVLAPVLIALAGLLAPPASQGQSSLYTDPVAHEPGDVLTVIIDERASAERESSYEGNSNASVGGGGSASGGGSAGGSGLSSQFEADAQINSQTENTNQTEQSGTLSGTLTVRVVEVNQAGNLLVEGRRNLTVNGATHIMEVSGIVRANDIRHDNTVLSHQIANAKIKYNQSGMRHNGFFSKGFLLKAGSAVLIGVSIFLGLN